MQLEIITANVSHAAAISIIGKKSFSMSFEPLFNRKEDLSEYLEYTYNHKKLVSGIRKENNIYFMALIDGEPAGFAKVKKHSLNPEINWFVQSELQKIYVLPEYHGSGAGTALMQSVIHLAKEMQPDYLWLDTYVGNTKAVSFYEKNGFKKHARYSFIIGTQSFQYHLMALPIQVAVETNMLTLNH